MQQPASTNAENNIGSGWVAGTVLTVLVFLLRLASLNSKMKAIASLAKKVGLSVTPLKTAAFLAAQNFHSKVQNS